MIIGEEEVWLETPAKCWTKASAISAGLVKGLETIWRMGGVSFNRDFSYRGVRCEGGNVFSPGI